MLSCPDQFIFFIFFKHKKHIAILSNSGNMSIPNQVRYCFLFISFLTLETYVLTMDSLDLAISFLDILLMLLLDFCNPYIKTTQYNVL